MTTIMTGTFTSDGNPRNIALEPGYNDIELINITDIGLSDATTPVMYARGTSSMAAGSGYYAPKVANQAYYSNVTTTTTGGFTFVSDSGNTALSAAVAVTAVSNVSPPIVSTGSTAGLSSGDIVRLTGTTGALNIASMDFTIDTIVANTSFRLPYMGAPGAAATAGFWRRVPFYPMFYPSIRYITKITKATSAVITLSVTHQYTVGQDMRIVVPAAFGMVEMNGLIGQITAIDTTNNTITVNIDSTGFTTFAFPTSAVAASGVTFAQTVPIAEIATILDGAENNISFRGVTIGATVQTTGKLYQWIAKEGYSL